MFTYLWYVDLSAKLCMRVFGLAACGIAPQHFEHSEIAFHDFAAIGSICYALMLNRPVMSVGVLVQSISGS